MAVMFAGVALVSWPQKERKRLDEDQQKDPSTAGVNGHAYLPENGDVPIYLTAWGG